MSSNLLITSAAEFASNAHLYDMRRELNEPYIIHPIRVANLAAQLGMDAEFIAAAYLHDVVEDTSVPMATIRNIFPVRTADLVDAMTKWWSNTTTQDAEQIQEFKQQYYAKLMRVPDGPLLKVLDRIDNLRDFTRMANMSPKTHKWAAKYAKKTTEEFPAILARVSNAKAIALFNAALTGLEAVV